MHAQHVYDGDLAQGSYLIGCQASGEAIVVDPRRDVDVYLRAADEAGLRITDVADTHVHADYLSGARELADRTGARLWLSAEGGPDWTPPFPHRPLHDGDVVHAGNVRIEAIHTPGHTPEHLSFLVTDGATSDQPAMILTGDFVFVGDVGRPDLLDEAAGGEGTRFAGATDLFASLRDRFLTLPDHVQVWPGHGAGSACGKALGAVPSTTVGYERLTAWWTDAVQANDEARFTEQLLADQPDAPAYFGRMKRWNLSGPALLGERPEPPRLDPQATARRLAAGEILFLDTRTLADWHQDAVDGALFVPSGSNFATYASYAIDPEQDDAGIVVLAEDARHAAQLRDKLSWTGIDRFEGFVSDLTPFARSQVSLVQPDDLARHRDAFQVLDTRAATEHRAGHIEDAVQLHSGRIRWHLDRVPTDAPLVAHCQSGGRSAVAASVLRLHGHPDVRELRGGYDAWIARQGRSDAVPA
ncbi:MAG: MBL fold metallo-hydrolase [Trueperaceae bacterium]